MRRFQLILIVTSSLASAAWGASPFHVGVANREFLQGDPAYNWRGAKTHALITTIWYPARIRATETQQWAGDPAHPLAYAGQASRDADLVATPKRFPPFCCRMERVARRA
jgi:hypothetical protein